MSHIIIGGGPAATNAAETIRQFDADCDITLVSDEPAHSRMALPYWLCGNIPREQTHTGDDAYFEALKVQTKFGARVDSIDAAGSSLTLNGGEQLAFDNLLIATGSSPIKPPMEGADLSRVHTLWSLADTQAVLDDVGGNDKPHVVLIGAGFIGFIVLNAMFKRGWRLSVVEREQQILPRMLDAAAADSVSTWLSNRDIATHCGETVSAIREQGDKRIVALESGGEIEADVVILAVGVKANTELAQSAGLDIDQGILVNDRQQTSAANIYAAGDVAQGAALFSDAKEVHAIQPTAVDHGRVAGANMAGRETHYPGSLSMNVTDVCGLQTASYGAWNASDVETVVIDNRQQHIYRKLLFRDDLMVGAVFTGRANDMGMLSDLGMVKGILQTQTPLGPWRKYLEENPFDIRRAYIGAGIAQKLMQQTLLGAPSKPRKYRHGSAAATTNVGTGHSSYVSTKE